MKSPPSDILDHSSIINGIYIQPNNSVYILPAVIDVKKLLKPTFQRINLPGDYDLRWAGQCVGYVKYALKDLAPDLSGNAEDWQKYINSNEPVVGSVVVIKVGRWGHLGVVVASQDNRIAVRSRNWRGLWIISDDEFEIGDERIFGYITF